MSTADILAALQKLTQADRRQILYRIMELDDEADILDERCNLADEAFQLLDRIEADDASNLTG